MKPIQNLGLTVRFFALVFVLVLSTTSCDSGPSSPPPGSPPLETTQPSEAKDTSRDYLKTSIRIVNDEDCTACAVRIRLSEATSDTWLMLSDRFRSTTWIGSDTLYYNGVVAPGQSTSIDVINFRGEQPIIADLEWICGDNEIRFADTRLEKAIMHELEMLQHSEHWPDVQLSEEGVKFIHALFVEELDVNGLGVRDIQGMEAFVELRRLNLSDNEIGDVAPLASLRRLEELDLSGNNISDISPVCELETLRWLSVARNKIASIDSLANLLRLLDVIDLSFNELTSIEPLSQMSPMMNLSLKGNQIRDLSPLAEMYSRRPSWIISKFYTLDLSQNLIQDVSPLGGVLLGMLDLSDNQIVDISPLSQQEEMWYLDLSRNAIEHADAVANLPNLQSLFLAGNRLRNAPQLEQSSKLVALDISDNAISGLEELANASLHDLICSNNNVTDLGPLSTHLEMRTLILADNDIEDITPLSGMEKLLQLDLSRNEISSAVPISEMRYLHLLWLAGNPLTSVSNLPYVTLPGEYDGTFRDTRIRKYKLYSCDTPHLDLRNTDVSDVSELIRRGYLARGLFIALTESTRQEGEKPPSEELKAEFESHGVLLCYFKPSPLSEEPPYD